MWLVKTPRPSPPLDAGDGDSLADDVDANGEDSSVEPAVARRIEFEVSCQSEACDFDMHFVNTDIEIPSDDPDDDGDGLPDPWFHPHADCHYASSQPDWGVLADTTDNPKLVEQADDIGSAGGIEAVEYPNPVNTEYLVGGTAHTGDMNVTLRVYIDGVMAYTDDFALDERGLWCGAVIDWTNQTVTGCTIGVVPGYLN